MLFGKRLPFEPHISKLYYIWQKMRNSVKPQTEECICCCNGPACLDTTHKHNSRDQIKLVVYDPHSGSNTAGTAKGDQLNEAEINGENAM